MVRPKLNTREEAIVILLRAATPTKRNTKPFAKCQVPFNSISAARPHKQSVERHNILWKHQLPIPDKQEIFHSSSRNVKVMDEMKTKMHNFDVIRNSFLTVLELDGAYIHPKRPGAEAEPKHSRSPRTFPKSTARASSAGSAGP
jgi:hypothetical protein